MYLALLFADFLRNPELEQQLFIMLVLNNSQCALYYVITYSVNLVKSTKIFFFPLGIPKSVFLCKGGACFPFYGLKDKIKKWLNR